MEFVDCALQRWSPGIGDPNVMGWLTVVVYALAAMATGRRAMRGPFEADSRLRERLFWGIATGLLVLLAVNKQLDLQTFFTEIGRCVARAQGWYEDRREVQLRFIIGIVIAGAAAIVCLWLVMRGTLKRTGLAVLGLGFVCSFVLIRAAGFHHVDTLINTTVAGLRMNWLLEMPGPALVAIAALRGSTPT